MHISIRLGGQREVRLLTGVWFYHRKIGDEGESHEGRPPPALPHPP